MIRLAVRAVLALPPRPRKAVLMPLYRFVYRTHGRHWRLNTLAMAPDYVFVAGGSSRVPGLPDRVEGRAGYVAAQRQMLDAVDIARVEVEDILPLSGDRVVVLSRFVIGSTGGTVFQQCLELHEFRRGAFVRQTYWFDREEGRRELGL